MGFIHLKRKAKTRCGERCRNAGQLVQPTLLKEWESGQGSKKSKARESLTGSSLKYLVSDLEVSFINSENRFFHNSLILTLGNFQDNLLQKF